MTFIPGLIDVNGYKQCNCVAVKWSNAQLWAVKPSWTNEIIVIRTISHIRPYVCSYSVWVPVCVRVFMCVCVSAGVCVRERARVLSAHAYTYSNHKLASTCKSARASGHKLAMLMTFATMEMGVLANKAFATVYVRVYSCVCVQFAPLVVCVCVMCIRVRRAAHAWIICIKINTYKIKQVVMALGLCSRMYALWMREFVCLVGLDVTCAQHSGITEQNRCH